MKGRQRDTMGGRLQLSGVMGEGIDLGGKKIYLQSPSLLYYDLCLNI